MIGGRRLSARPAVTCRASSWKCAAKGLGTSRVRDVGQFVGRMGTDGFRVVVLPIAEGLPGLDVYQASQLD
jgi:hypothetical protein